MAVAKKLSEKCTSSVAKDCFTTDSSSNIQINRTKFNANRIPSKLFRDIINTTDEGFFITDSEGNFLNVNDAYCVMTGFSREELLSMSIYDIDFKYINMDRSEAKKNFLNAQTNIFSDHKHQYFLVNQRRKNGQVIDVSASVKWIDSWGGITFHFNRDVTEEIKIKKSLAESEELYRSLIELGGNVGDAVVMLGNTEPDKGKQVFVSNKWADITGYSKEELADKSFYDIVCPIDEDVSTNKKIINTEILFDCPLELNVLQKNGGILPIEISCGTNIYQGQQVVVVYIKDISKRKRFEDDLKKHQQYLQDLVTSRTEELQKVNMKLGKSYEEGKELRLEIERQLNSKVNLVRAMVHELKTPLTPMIGTSKIMMDRLQDNSLHRMARNIYRGSENLNRRITDLMDYVSGAFEEIQLHCDEMDAVKLLSETIAMVTPEAEVKNQYIVLNVKRPIPEVYADEDRIRQVLLNLLNNALKFTPSEGHINVTIDFNGSKILISIEDDGCGIAEEEQNDIFNYKKALELNHRKRDSFGIGLPLSKMLVELHGGEIWFESQKGRGSKFSFSIPLKKED
jgi:PAS domain S-box-containing protein